MAKWSPSQNSDSVLVNTGIFIITYLLHHLPSCLAWAEVRGDSAWRDPELHDQVPGWQLARQQKHDPDWGKYHTRQ